MGSIAEKRPEHWQEHPVPDACGVRVDSVSHPHGVQVALADEAVMDLAGGDWVVVEGGEGFVVGGRGGFYIIIAYFPQLKEDHLFPETLWMFMLSRILCMSSMLSLPNREHFHFFSLPDQLNVFVHLLHCYTVRSVFWSSQIAKIHISIRTHVRVYKVDNKHFRFW
jgi:hypothetical protein